jgi:pimeloyl-ACP methyl ester carboxylesterase
MVYSLIPWKFMTRSPLLLIFIIGIWLMPAFAQDMPPADLVDADGKFADVNGIHVYYVDRGPQDGEPVFLLHGFLGSLIDWTNTYPALTEAGYRVIAFDRPPFGLSDKRTDLSYTAKAMAELTAGLMDELGIEQASFIGHSQGGAVMAYFVLLYPERVVKLGLISAAIDIQAADYAGEMPAMGIPGFDPATIDPDSPIAQSIMRAIFSGSFGSNLLNSAVNDPDSIDPDLMTKRMRGLRVPGWEGGLLAFVRDSVNPDNQIDVEELASVEVPVLLLWGAEDRLVPITVGERLRELFPDNQWIAYPDVGHVPMDEATERFNADLVEFLASR